MSASPLYARRGVGLRLFQQRGDKLRKDTYVRADGPFCCASFRCSLPQRRALPRRVSPSRQQNRPSCSLPWLLVAPYPFVQAVFLLLLLGCDSQARPPPPASLPSLLLRLLLRESWRGSQKTLHANRRARDVRHGGGSNGGGLFPCCFCHLSEILTSHNSLL